LHMSKNLSIYRILPQLFLETLDKVR